MRPAIRQVSPASRESTTQVAVTCLDPNHYERILKLTLHLEHTQARLVSSTAFRTIFPQQFPQAWIPSPDLCCGTRRDMSDGQERAQASSCAGANIKEIDVRIICDHCNHPVFGTVKRVSGNLNLHPQCLAQLGSETKQQSTSVWGRSQESSFALNKNEPSHLRVGQQDPQAV